MRRGEREIKDPALIDEIIRRAQVCHLGLCDGDQPYVIPMSFGYEGNALYLHCATEGRKIDILRRNNKACFQVETDYSLAVKDNPCGADMKYRSVIGFGRVSLVEDPAEKRRAFAILMRQYSPGTFTFPDAALARTRILRLDIEHMTGKQSGYGGAVTHSKPAQPPNPPADRR